MSPRVLNREQGREVYRRQPGVYQRLLRVNVLVTLSRVWAIIGDEADTEKQSISHL